MTASTTEILERAAELARRNEPYVLATVVWCRPPTSAKPGDRALVTPDGVLVGWIGGGCSEPAVVRECLRALREGTARLLHLGPADERREARAGEVIETIRCASEGSLEVFVEPHRSRPHLVIVGDAPVAGALARLAEAIEYDVVRIESVEPGGVDLGAAAVRPGSHVVVATLGRADEAALEAALATPAGYIALVGSRKRAEAVRETLRRSGVPEAELARIRAPAGLDLGRIAHREIAVAILAEIVRQRAKRGPPLDAADEADEADEAPSEPERASGSAPGAHAIDPVCGMTVEVESARFTAERDGRTYYFCCDGCRRRFESEPARYASAGGD